MLMMFLSMTLPEMIFMFILPTLKNLHQKEIEQLVILEIFVVLKVLLNYIHYLRQKLFLTQIKVYIAYT